MKIKIIKIFVISLLMLCIGCGGDLSHENKKKLDEMFFTESDTIVKELPKDKNGEIIIDRMKNQRQAMAGVGPLENGFDSIKIRFWYLYDTMQIVEIENANKKWSSSQYTIEFGYTERLDSIISYAKTVKHNNPKTGWENFIRKLFNANVLILPSCESYYAHATDASMIEVEIATKHKYKIYRYSDPLHNKDFFGAKSMVEIMDLIEEEFDFKRIERF